MGTNSASSFKPLVVCGRITSQFLFQFQCHDSFYRISYGRT